MSELHRITFDPAICAGRPCLRGRRIRVGDLLDLLAAGASRQEILDDYPDLEENDIVAALEYAARTRHGKPAGVLIGFESEDDGFEYRLEHDPRFLRRIAQARESLRAGRGTRLEDLDLD